MILYLHGFASTGQGGKWEVLRDAFPGHDVQSPTLPVDPLETMEYVRDLFACTSEPHLAVGTSLGGFFAYHCAARLKIPAVIINPAMQPWNGMEQHIGTVERFDTDGDTFEWTRRHVENLRVLADQSGRAPGELVHFFLARDDELLDHSALPEQYPEAATMQFFDSGGHRFERFAELVPAIRKIVRWREQTQR